MLERSDVEKIKKTAKEFFDKTTFAVEVEASLGEEGTVFVGVKTDEPQILIGEGGQTLLETQHLLKLILKRKIAEPFFLDLDINEYKKKKTDYLKETASSVADEVVLSKKEKVLNPMPAYERRIVHMELANRTDVTTESIGEEPERRIVVRPRP